MVNFCCYNSKTLGVALRQLVFNPSCSLGFANVQRIHSSFPDNKYSSLAVLLQIARDFLCTDPHDHVFALLGLASDRDAFRRLRPDYASPAGVTFRRYAICCVSDMKNLSLSGAWVSEYGRDPDMPSWVPDLGKPSDDRSYARELLWFRATCICRDKRTQSGPSVLPETPSDETGMVAGVHKMLETLNQSLANIRALNRSWANIRENRVTESLACQAELRASISNDERILTVRGVVLDTIGTVSSPFQGFLWIDSFYDEVAKQVLEAVDITPSGTLPPSIARFQWHAMADWLRECQTIASDKGGGRLSAARLVQLSRTLLWNIAVPDGRKTLSLDRCVLFARFILMAGKRALHEHDPEWLKRFKSLADKFAGEMATMWQGRGFCATVNGRHLGSVLGEARAGDKICLFYGGSLPYVIRACGDGQSRFIGDCYLHGFMLGEGMALDTEPEDFPLI